MNTSKSLANMLTYIRIVCGLTAAIFSGLGLACLDLANELESSERHLPLVDFGLSELVTPTMIMGALLACGVLLSIGLFARCCSILISVITFYSLFTYNCYYQSSFYLFALLCLINGFAGSRNLPGREPDSEALMILLFQFQLLLVYFYSGISKLDTDWWCGATLRAMLLVERPIFAEQISKAPILLQLASGVVCIAEIGLPLLYLVARHRLKWHVTFLLSLFHVITFFVLELKALPLFLLTLIPLLTVTPRKSLSFVGSKGLLVFAYIVVQLAVPLRQFLYHGSMIWTGEGFKYSWVMRSVVKDGEIGLLVRGVDGREILLGSRDMSLNQVQAQAILFDPTSMLELARQIGKEYREKWGEDVSVYAVSSVSLNGRPPVTWIDPHVDLLQEEKKLFSGYSWILKRPRSICPNLV